MFNFSGSETIFILLAALVVLGPEKLPGALRQVGRIYGELRKMGQGFQSEMKAAFDEPMREMKETADLAKSSLRNPLGDDAPSLADVKPRSISESVRRMLENSDGPATADEVAALDARDEVDAVLAAERGMFEPEYPDIDDDEPDDEPDDDPSDDEAVTT